MDNASVVKITADKVALHVAAIAPYLTNLELLMVQDLLGTILKFPIVETNDTKEEEDTVTG
jgi:hypothetical protein